MYPTQQQEIRHRAKVAIHLTFPGSLFRPASNSPQGLFPPSNPHSCTCSGDLTFFVTNGTRRPVYSQGHPPGLSDRPVPKEGEILPPPGNAAPASRPLWRICSTSHSLLWFLPVYLKSRSRPTLQNSSYDPAMRPISFVSVSFLRRQIYVLDFLSSVPYHQTSPCDP